MTKTILKSALTSSAVSLVLALMIPLCLNKVPLIFEPACYIGYFFPSSALYGILFALPLPMAISILIIGQMIVFGVVGIVIGYVFDTIGEGPFVWHSLAAFVPSLVGLQVIVIPGLIPLIAGFVSIFTAIFFGILTNHLHSSAVSRTLAFWGGLLSTFNLAAHIPKLLTSITTGT